MLLKRQSQPLKNKIFFCPLCVHPRTYKGIFLTRGVHTRTQSNQGGRMADEHQREIWRRASRKYVDKYPERRHESIAKYVSAHRDRILIRHRKFKEKLVSEGRCPSCGYKLIKGETKYCINCCGRTKGEFAYATSCQRYSQELRNISG